MRHPVKLYITFVAFVLFVSMTTGMIFWFASRVSGTFAGSEKAGVQQELTVDYEARMNDFLADYAKAADKIAFLESNKKFLFEISVPKEYLEKHLKVVSAVDSILRGVESPNVLSDMAEAFISGSEK